MKFKNILLMGLAAAVLTACGNTTPEGESKTVDLAAQANSAKLDLVLEGRDEAAKARFDQRHPKETLMFFGITPGMTVVDVLPGGGWYTKILLPYLGNEGTVIGVDYALEMWPEFGGFATPEFIENKKTWPATWTESAEAWRSDDAAGVSAFAFGNRNVELDGTADAVLFIRALHNLARFEDEGGYLTQALADVHAMLKPGGIVGVVQHQAREDRQDDWADGSNGYLKKSAIIAKFDAAGFDFVAESDINENPMDQAKEGDAVWRLPPTLGTSRDDDELRAEMQAIGESHRMTLKFKKR
ncbi:class I SAM-dependent methyltransferase [Litorimonas taeanensis]|nr:class I SAM-dependent methyltransferase [Litorimonas taeanensis]